MNVMGYRGQVTDNRVAGSMRWAVGRTACGFVHCLVLTAHCSEGEL